MNTKNKILLLTALFTIFSSVLLVHAVEDFSAALDLINNKVPCSQLSEDQLVQIGDYYMEQMHPGEAHERIETMMGGEDSETVRQAHINIANSFYCGNAVMFGNTTKRLIIGSRYGMMGGNYQAVATTNNTGYGMMGRTYSKNTNYGMMGYNSPGSWFARAFLSILGVAIAALVFGLIFWWTYKVIVKDNKRK